MFSFGLTSAYTTAECFLAQEIHTGQGMRRGINRTSTPGHLHPAAGRSSPRYSCFLWKTSLVMLWVLLVPVLCSLPCPQGPAAKSAGPGQECSWFWKALAWMLNEASQTCWAVVAASTYIDPEVLNFCFESLASFQNMHVEREICTFFFLNTQLWDEQCVLYNTLRDCWSQSYILMLHLLTTTVLALMKYGYMC